MRVGLLFCLGVCGWFMSVAEAAVSPTNSHPISLQACIDLALSQNLDLQVQHLSTDIVRDQLTASYGPYVPSFSFFARHDTLSQPADFDPKKSGIDFPYQLNTDLAGTALNGVLPFGFSYNLNGQAGRKDARTDFNANPNTAANFFDGIRRTNNFFAESGLNAQQHLLKDFWMDQNMQTVLFRRKDLKISQQALRFQIMRTVLAVELGYYDLIASRERVRVAEKALALNQQLVAEMKRRVEVGDLPPLDQEQAETELQNALSILTAAQDEVFDRQTSLKNLITSNFQTWANTDLEPTETLGDSRVEPDKSESFRRALENRPDLVEARLLVERSDVAVSYRFNQLFPNLDLVGGYGGLAIHPDSVSGAMSDAMHFRDPVYYYGAVFTVPLNNLAERGNYHASKAAKEIAQLQVKKAEQDVLVQVAVWVYRVQSRYSQVGYTRKARTYAESALAAEQKKLQNGLSTTFVVLQLQQILTTARTAEVQALAGYNTALAQLAFAEGTTLERHRIRLEAK